jgi:hypothetical protein
MGMVERLYRSRERSEIMSQNGLILLWEAPNQFRLFGLWHNIPKR